jgi:lysophospholipid acyltransferase (LPLAT)-like uncharacterized protein
MTPDDAADGSAAAPVKKHHRFTPVPATSLKARVLSFLIAWLVRLYSFTLRIHLDNKANLIDGSGAVIWAFWHNRLLVLPVAYRRFAKHRPGCVLTSPSGDGALIAAIMKRFGLESVRGSTNKRAAQSLVECRRRLLDGWDLSVTPDGPRGPVHVAAPGLVQLARLTQCPVVPVQVDYSRFWQLKSWDRFRIPKPFSRVTITLAPPLNVGAKSIEEECQELGEALSGEGARED